jgi:polysaccharide export outer membrane protein
MRRTALAVHLSLAIIAVHGADPASAPEARPAPAGATAIAPASGVSTPDNPLYVPPDYRIASGDQLDFMIFGEADVAATQRVSSAGDIRLPMIGTMVVSGLTLREAEAKLEAQYRAGGFFVSPQVILSVRQYIERAVSVLGQVNKPDRIVLPVETRSIGIVRVLTLAGGLTRIAKTDAIVVTRPGADGKESRTVINLSDYLDSKKATNVEEFNLLPGDIVYVPERTF